MLQQLGYFKREMILESISPQKEPEKIPVEFLPLKFPWIMRKGSAGSDMFYSSYLPRKPKVVFSVNVSANMGGRLANAVIEGDKIFLADHQGIYALNRDDGALIWGVEVYSDSLEGRSISYPQPVTKWKALGLWRFVEAYGVGKYLFVGTSSRLDIDDAYLLALDKNSVELV